MPFQFDQSAFPLLTPQQTSPLGGVLSDAIAKRLAMAKTQAEEEKAPYAGISSLADTLSKSAYAGAVTPQFQSKLLENIMTAANIPDPEKRRLLGQILNYGGAQGGAGMSTNPAINQLQQLINQKLQQATQPKKSIADSLRGFFTGNQEAPASAPMMQDGGPPEINQPAIDQFNRDRGQAAPVPGQEQPEPQRQGGDWFGNIGNAKGKIAQKEEEGRTRGKNVGEYGADTKVILGQERATNNLIKLLNDPALKKLPNIPFANKVSMKVLRNAGSKEFREKIGELDAAMNLYITSSANAFGPRTTDADLAFLQSMKPSDADSWEAKKGKIVALKAYNEAKMKQTKLANRYVQSGMNQTDAEIEADKHVDVNKIEDEARQKVFGRKSGGGDWNHLSDEELMRHIHG